MLKKLFYFGIGLADLIYENFDDLVHAGEERYSKLVGAEKLVEQTIEIETIVSVEEPVAEPGETVAAETDDLTAINGIGPTFAGRLQAAGITSFQALASLTGEQVKEITKVADWQADPDEWIVAAGAMA